MDTRRDPGQYYPGGKVISTRPVATGGDVKHSDFEDLDVRTNTLPDLRAAVKGLAARLGATVVTALAVCVAIGATVEKAKLNELDFDADPSVVTDVTFEGLSESSNVYTKAETEAKIVELAPQTETDPFWSAEKSGYATKDDLESGMLTVNRAEYAESARDAYSAEHATLAEGLRDGPTEIYADTIFSRLDAAETTNAQQTAALDAKLDKTGGTMTGSLVVESIESNVHVGQTDSGAELTIGHLRHAPQLVKINCYGAIHIIDSETGSSRFIVQIPYKSGTLALLSDIPTTMAWSAITGKPTTISGYGITDALKSDFASLTNNAAFTSAVAAVSPPTDTSELEARGFVRIVADDEIYFVTITTTQTEE